VRPSLAAAALRSAAAAAAVVLASCAGAPRADVTPSHEATAPAVAPPTLADLHRGTAARIVEASLMQDRAHARLRHLCDRIGPRLSGSRGLDAAVAWAAAELEADGFRVAREKVLVPKWVRGRESAVATAPVERALVGLGLGNSVGTPPGGIDAEVVVARDFDALAALGDRVRGRIVLFNRPMPAYDPERGAGYGEAVAYRTQGPSRAAKLGAVAVLVRSVTATSLRTPHTGMLAYDAEVPRVPAMAVTVEDAEWIARCDSAGETVRVRLTMDARFEPDVPSANVVADLVGAERPDEIVLVGAHLDSWDVGHGAHDDGANCVAVMEALAVLRRLGLRPRRTIRAVLYTNEENGLRGALGYATQHQAELARHVAAIEADAGCTRPLGFTTPAAEGSPRQARFRQRMSDLLTLLGPLGASRLRDGGGGADIGVLASAGVPQLGLDVDGRAYFDVHHTEADTFDKVAKDDLDRVVAVLAVTAFVLADAPGRLDD
jgi:carboxypeptidase Q